MFQLIATFVLEDYEQGLKTYWVLGFGFSDTFEWACLN